MPWRWIQSSIKPKACRLGKWILPLYNIDILLILNMNQIVIHINECPKQEYDGHSLHFYSGDAAPLIVIVLVPFDAVRLNVTIPLFMEIEPD